MRGGKAAMAHHSETTKMQKTPVHRSRRLSEEVERCQHTKRTVGKVRRIRSGPMVRVRRQMGYSD